MGEWVCACLFVRMGGQRRKAFKNCRPLPLRSLEVKSSRLDASSNKYRAFSVLGMFCERLQNDVAALCVHFDSYCCCSRKLLDAFCTEHCFQSL